MSIENKAPNITPTIFSTNGRLVRHKITTTVQIIPSTPNAEIKANRIIQEEDVDKALESANSISLRYILNSLSDKEQKLLRFITRVNSKEITAGELYKEYNRENKISYSTFGRLVNKLEFLRLIDTTYTGNGQKGNSRFITLRFNAKLIRENLPKRRINRKS